MRAEIAPKVLFATSNGTGLGHLTRSLAVARRLPSQAEAIIFTLSGAAGVVRDLGFPIEYMPSHNTAGAGPILSWNRRLARRLEALIEEFRPDALVFDGAHPYPAVVRTVRRNRHLRSVWVRRAMWKARRGRIVLAWSGEFDLVLEPGELAAEIDVGATVARRDETLQVDPIVYLDRSELLSRPDAERTVGLEPGKVNALVNLGQGPEVDGAVERCLARLTAEPGIQVATLESSLSPGLEVPDRVVRLRDTYPVSRLYRAFDFVVSASGYNAYHELLHLAVPTLFVPMPRELDDQAARARYADQTGIGLACEGPASPRLLEQLGRMLDRGERERMAERASALDVGNGAHEAARALSKLATTVRPSRRLSAGRRAASLGASALACGSAIVRYPGQRLSSSSGE